MSNNDGWTKVEIAPTWEFESDKEIIGAFVGVEENVGPNNSRMYTLEVAGGEKVGVWGNAVLDTRMKNVTEGEEVKIVYLGKKESEKVKGRSYHNFEVYHRKPAFVKASGMSKEDEDLANELMDDKT